MTTRAYTLCLQAALYALADRLAYLGYYGDSLKEFVDFILNEKDLHAYHDVTHAADAAGFDPVIDRRTWPPGSLPGVSGLTYLPDALEVSVTKYLDSAGRYSLDAQGRFIWPGGNS